MRRERIISNKEGRCREEGSERMGISERRKEGKSCAWDVEGVILFNFVSFN